MSPLHPHHGDLPHWGGFSGAKSNLLGLFILIPGLCGPSHTSLAESSSEKAESTVVLTRKRKVSDCSGRPLHQVWTLKGKNLWDLFMNQVTARNMESVDANQSNYVEENQNTFLKLLLQSFEISFLMLMRLFIISFML